MRDGFLQGACDAPVAFALALRLALTVRRRERNPGIGLRTALEYWENVDDITIATTAEVAPFILAKLNETLEKHGLELRNDKCTAHCPTPERSDNIREEMIQFVKWTPNDLMILGTATDVEYRTEIMTQHGKVTNPRVAGQNMRESWQTGSDEYVKPTWNADALRLPRNWLPFFERCFVL